MIRLFTPDTLTLDTPVALTEPQVHYLLHVMRQKTGNEVLLFNGRDGEWLSDITDLSKKKGAATPRRQIRRQKTEKPLILCPALIKKEKMDWVFEKATELGATRIIPLLTHRTVVSRLNLDRARLLTIEAAEQCERLSVPQVDEPIPLNTILKMLPLDVTVVCLSERGATTAAVPRNKPVAFLIGPEGGWTTMELDTIATRPNTVFRHLGNEILRSETASVAALACYRFSLF